MAQSNKETGDKNAVTKREKSYAERFQRKVEQEFSGSIGQQVKLSEYQRGLASNMFIKIDETMNELEKKRQKGGKKSGYPSITWSNVDMRKLAIDAMHRVRLGLDALEKNHIHPIPYFNSKKGVYDIDLRIGYAGKRYYKIATSYDDVKDIRVELIHENDTFEIYKKDAEHEKDTYKHEINNPLDRGDVVGGYAYIVYSDESKNKIIVLNEGDFKKYRSKAMSSDFWDNWPHEMRLKTLVHRACDLITSDPRKINDSYHYVEQQETDQMKEDPEIQGRKEIDIPDEPEEDTEVSEDGRAQVKGTPFDYETKPPEGEEEGKDPNTGDMFSEEGG